MTQFRPSRFQVLPPVIKNLIIINVLVFLAQITIDKQFDLHLLKWFALYTWQSPWFRPWQIITHMFMHGSPEHLFYNMFSLWMFGSVLENLWGAKKFLIFYFACGLGAVLADQLVTYFLTEKIIHDYETMKISLEVAQRKLFGGSIGASGSTFGCLAGFGYLFAEETMYMWFFPIKVKWMVMIYTVGEIFMMFDNAPDDNVGHIAHLGGAVVGFALVYFWNKTNKKRFY